MCVCYMYAKQNVLFFISTRYSAVVITFRGLARHVQRMGTDSLSVISRGCLGRDFWSLSSVNENALCFASITLVTVDVS